MLPCSAIILNAVSSSDQPGWTDDGRSTDVTEIFNVEADLPGKLSLFCVLTTDDTGSFEHVPPAVWGANANHVMCGGVEVGFYRRTQTSRGVMGKLRSRLTYHSWPRQSRPHSQRCRHIQGSL